MSKLLYDAALALYHTDVAVVDDQRHFSLPQMHRLRAELIQVGYSVEDVDSNGTLPPLEADDLSWGGGPASALEPRDQFIFSENIGGEGEVLTVVSTRNAFGIVSIETEEKDFDVQVQSHQGLFIREQG